MELLNLTRSGSVVTIALDRPEQHNAFNPQMIDELRLACEHIGRDTAVRVVVLTGAGRSFCAGADLEWMRSTLQLSHEENIADAERLAAMYEALDTLAKPVIGRVNGAAIGGGAGLVACCDIVVAAERVAFGFGEVKLGLIPALIARYVVPKIGAGHARALFVSGRRFDAGLAQRIGLVHDVVPVAKLDAVVQQAVDDVLSSGPEAIGRAKQLVRAAMSLPRDEWQRYTVEAIAEARTGAEAQEGLRAFLEKRRPSWAPRFEKR